MSKKSGNKPIKEGVAKVPVVMQMEALECGAACLDMILAYYGRYVPLSQMRKDCGVSRDGSSAGKIKRAAENYGLKADAYMRPLALLQMGMTFPCMIFWDRNHFVVLNGIKKDTYYVNDPGKGLCKYSADEFAHHYSNVCMTFEPTENFEPGGKPDSISGFVKEQLKGAGKMIIMVLLAYLVITLVGILMPLFPRIFVDYILQGSNTELWKNVFFISFGALALIRIIAEWIKTSFLYKMRGKMSISANTSYMWHILRMPMEFFAQRSDGDLIGRKSALANISNIFIVTGVPLFLDLCTMIVYLIVMFTYSPLLSIIGLVSVAVNLIITNNALKSRLNLARREKTASIENNMDAYIGISMIDTIKSAGVEDSFFEKWAGSHAESVAVTAQITKQDSIHTVLPELINNLFGAVVLCFSVGLLIRGDWTMGIISAFTGYLSAFSNPAVQILNVYREFQTLQVDISRYEDVMEYEEDIPSEIKPFDENKKYELLSGKIEFENITFGYSPLSPPLITDFSMKVEPGRTVAFVGGSGSGKSTLAKLLTGLYKPWSGKILLDGIPREEIDRDILTASISSVDQDISLFGDTVMNNIKMWDDSIEDYEAILAARNAGIHNDISRRDKGYNSKVLEGGKNFSGGQRQRLEIARTLAVTPSIIILDEATSALDAETENQVMNSMKDLGVTMVVISHRLSTIRDCDEIIVLKEGQVVDRGKHADLMERCDYYNKMITQE